MSVALSPRERGSRQAAQILDAMSASAVGAYSTATRGLENIEVVSNTSGNLDGAAAGWMHEERTKNMRSNIRTSRGPS